MGQIFLGKDVLKHRDDFADLPEEFFALLDPEGTNVVQEVQKAGTEYRCICQIKLKDKTEPLEVFIVFSEDMYHSLVHTIDINSLRGVN